MYLALQTCGHLVAYGTTTNTLTVYQPVIDIVEAHCYVVDIGQIDIDQIHSRINNKSTAYKTLLHTVDKGLRGRSILQSVVTDSTTH